MASIEIVANPAAVLMVAVTRRVLASRGNLDRETCAIAKSTLSRERMQRIDGGRAACDR